MSKPIQVNRVKVGGNSLVMIAGPCVVENRKLAFEIAVKLKQIARQKKIGFIFKASYDKANRSSGRSFRGPGLAEGLKILADIKQELDVPVLTDVHSVEEVNQAARVADVLQIPAFLCRQTDLLTAAARTGKPVNIKKGQFLAPADMSGVIQKVAPINPKILVTERGYSFGYNNLVVDMRSLEILRNFGYPVIMDATHGVQRPGGGEQSGGEREFVPVLVRAAAGAGVDGIFLETHPRPEKALSDKNSMLPLHEVSRVMESAVAVSRASRKFWA